MESIKSLKAILAKSARSDKARKKEGDMKPKSTNRIEPQYPRIIVPVPRVGADGTVMKSEGGVKRKEEREENVDERVVKLGGEGGLDGKKEVEGEESLAETVPLRSVDGASIISL